jgi:hypothetical protein
MPVCEYYCETCKREVHAQVIDQRAREGPRRVPEVRRVEATRARRVDEYT